MPLLQSVQYQDRRFRLLDLRRVHPSGNKFFKLKYNLEAAREQGADTILSFGGAWSNHIHALALRGAELGLKTIGVIRGERPKHLSPTLQDAEAHGMTLLFVSREEYRKKQNQAFIDAISKPFGKVYVLPEGGSNELGTYGATEIVDLLDEPYKEVFLPTATGGTLSGIANALPEGKHITGICVLKGEDTLSAQVSRMTNNKHNWSIDFCGHYGGYAKCPDVLKTFLLDFEAQTGIRLEPVYSGKMMFRLLEILEQQPELNSDETIAIHTGGMQGRRGFAF